MREVVGRLDGPGLPDDAAGDEIFQGADRLLLAPAARLPQGPEVEGPADRGRRAEHLPGDVAETGEPSVQKPAKLGDEHAVDRLARRERSQVLGHE